MDESTGPIQLVPNPQFVFPMQPSSSTGAESPTRRRPVSMQPSSSPQHPRTRTQRQSVSTLPTFTFNATDASGLSDNTNATPSFPMASPPTPSKSFGHRRGISEFVGGDSRLGVSSLVSSSPSKPADLFPGADNASVTGSPARKRGHAHRRSAAISSHDLSTILQPRDVNLPAAQGSAPHTPTEQAQSLQYFPNDKIVSDKAQQMDNFDRHRDNTTHDSVVSPRSSSRPRVGFSENVEYIPRPLSTVSSETASSTSTLRGHSVANSISSVIGMGAPSPQRSRSPAKRISFNHASSDSTSTIGASTSSNHAETNDEGRSLLFDNFPTSSEIPSKPEVVHAPRLLVKKNKLSKLDRRRSEPSMGVASLQHSRLSSLSLQEPMVSQAGHSGTEDHEVTLDALRRKSSRKRVKEWANAFLGRKTKDGKKTKSSAVSCPELPIPSPSAANPEELQTMDMEPDLDALFSQDPFISDSPVHPRIDMGPISAFSHASSSRYEGDDHSPVIDLDAALGPYGTPAWEGRGAGSMTARRQLHSDRITRHSVAPSMHSQWRTDHQRTMSAPATGFTPFDIPGSTSPSQSPMADVFEEDEEIDAESPMQPLSLETHTIDTDKADNDNLSRDDIFCARQLVSTQHFDSNIGTDINRADFAIESSPDASVRHIDVPLAVRRSSVLEDTIVEESGSLEVVQDFEEPRTSSITKSSDSSEASTILPAHSGAIISVSASSLLSTTTMPHFVSPDLSGRQGSFEVSRLGTSGSSNADNRTLSSVTSGEHGHDMRMSVDDVPSLTSSRSTMISTVHHNESRRDFSDRSGSVASAQGEAPMTEQRRKRASIQSLSRLVGASFGGESKNKSALDLRPQMTSTTTTPTDGKKRKENRLSRLMFWRRTSSRSEHESG